MDFYYTIDQIATATYKDRGSSFIAFAFPMDTTAAFKEMLVKQKEDHPKAVHHCFAYRMGVTGNQFRVNDDGEPSGSAGRPILGQIDSKQLTNIGVIVVRYFGGTLLGVPGLIKAYKTATALALQTVPHTKKAIEIPYILHFQYEQTNEVIQLLKQVQANIVEQEIQLFPFIKAAIPSHRLEEFRERIKNIRNVEADNLV
ncbi:MAG TPA: YigZ family protein [Ferruginibacter sp.]|nr:YigZ family protein [Ferruginibacter sp.]HRO16619.1 YigZ family protein [Ferruginibacter sp.]HRQ20775.1 YigZ family protein [Ferruginibacter sp.]